MCCGRPNLSKRLNFLPQVDPDWFLQGEGHPLPSVVPEQLLTSSGTNIVMPQASTLSQRQERLERYKDSFDLDIFEQVHFWTRLLTIQLSVKHLATF